LLLFIYTNETPKYLIIKSKFKWIFRKI
jgi:hypothetical protein